MNTIFRRNVTSITWLAFANGIGVVVLLARSILLARLLPVEIFGIYAFATAVVRATTPLVQFGMGAAFLVRHPETEDEERAAALHFTLKAAFSITWTALLLMFALFSDQGEMQTPIIVLVLTLGLQQIFLQTPRLILVRRVMHQRLALLQIVSDLLGTVAAIFLAAAGTGIWALISANIVNLFAGLLLFYGFRPVWTPSFLWSRSGARHFIRFGSRVVAANLLLQLLDTVDDLWAGFLHGTSQLGFYSRAYRFATYPRQLVAMPVNRVILGTYAGLKDQRLQLSQAFFRSNAFLIRAGFLSAGFLALIAPEMIQILLTEKWLPMLAPFRLMLLFTLLDPIKLSIGHLFTAVGHPEKLIRIRAYQFLVLAGSLVLLTDPFGLTGFALGISGVALATNIMLIAGTALLFHGARQYVDFSLRRLFIAPTTSLTAAMLMSLVVAGILPPADSPWTRVVVNGLPFIAVYLFLLIALERTIIREVIGYVWYRSSDGSGRGD